MHFNSAQFWLQSNEELVYKEHVRPVKNDWRHCPILFLPKFANLKNL
jgi:hypothetical protein